MWLPDSWWDRVTAITDMIRALTFSAPLGPTRSHLVRAWSTGPGVASEKVDWLTTSIHRKHVEAHPISDIRSPTRGNGHGGVIVIGVEDGKRDTHVGPDRVFRESHTLQKKVTYRVRDVIWNRIWLTVVILDGRHIYCLKNRIKHFFPNGIFQSVQFFRLRFFSEW